MDAVWGYGEPAESGPRIQQGRAEAGAAKQGGHYQRPAEVARAGETGQAGVSPRDGPKARAESQATGTRARTAAPARTGTLGHIMGERGSMFDGTAFDPDPPDFESAD